MAESPAVVGDEDPPIAMWRCRPERCGRLLDLPLELHGLGVGVRPVAPAV
jgi:hypothetical protein